MKKSFMTRILATGLSLAMAFSMAAATNVTTASAASKPAMITSAGASAKSLSLKVGEVTKIKVNAATKANYKVSAVKASSKRVRAAVIGSTVVAIRGLKATVEGKPSTVKVSFKSRKTNKTSKFTYSSKVTVIEDKLTVTGVTAANGTTLVVTGTKLGDLTATDVTVDGVTVTSYTAAADGKSATITLGTALVPNSTTNVTINGTSFAVKYETVSAAAVELTTTTFDNDTPNQQMKLKVNGAEMTVSELYANGYDTEFYAYSKAGIATGNADMTPTIFAKPDITNKFSTDGIIKNGPIDLGTYYIKAIVKKAGDVLVSDLTEIAIVDLDTQTTGVNKVVFKTGKYIAESTGTLKVVQNETLDITKVNITNAGKKYDITTLDPKNMSLKSSDPTVLEVKDHNTVQANKAGTAALTVTYGKQTIAITVTVDQVARKFAEIKADASNPTSIVAGTGEQRNFAFYAIDNHGAVMLDDQNVGIFARTSAEGVAKVSNTDGSGYAVTATKAVNTTDGKAIFSVQGVGAGTATISLFEAKFTSPGTISTEKVDAGAKQLNVTVRVVKNDTTSYALVSDAIDKEYYVQDNGVYNLNVNTLEARSQRLVLKLAKQQNAVESTTVPQFKDLSNAKIWFDGSVITVNSGTVRTGTSVTTGAAIASGDPLTSATYSYLEVIGKKAGSTTIKITYTHDGVEKTIQRAITVTNTTPVVASITPAKATFGDEDVKMSIDSIFDMGVLTTNLRELKSAVNYSANPTSLKIRYTEAGFTDGVTIGAGHLYIYNVGTKDKEATYYDLGAVYARVIEGTVANMGTDTQIKLAGTSIVASDSAKVNLYLTKTNTIDANSTCIATITVR